MKDKILELSAQGLSPRKIASMLGCSRQKVRYYTVPGEMNRAKKRATNSQKTNKGKINSKIKAFLKNNRLPKTKQTKSPSHINSIITNKIIHYHEAQCLGDCMFTYKDIFDKFGNNTKCYLTGKTININEPRTYEFDHIIPKSKGGTLTLDNLAICTKYANRAKSDLLLPELLQLCKDILEYHNHTVTKNNDCMDYII